MHGDNPLNDLPFFACGTAAEGVGGHCYANNPH